ncbi:MAG TPA: ABC transporter substrate-binding protein [Bryobacteraceae bacterium]|nr:ABC transporter substrate-binding protein [Bryobacteraceae bacterium]
MIQRSAICAASLLLLAFTSGPPDTELRLCLRSEPRTFDPLLVEDESSETIRYLTSGVLVRLNRATQQVEPELATSWKILDGGRRIDFQLRPGVRFSDGSPFTAVDVAYTIRRVIDPNVHASIGDGFRTGDGSVRTVVRSPESISVIFPAPFALLPTIFDQLAIVPANAPAGEKAVLGPFMVADYKAGNYVLLRRNPNYWRRDEAGHPLPYIGSVRLLIQQNRDLELMRFRRGEIDMISKLDPELFDRIAPESHGRARDAGPGLDSVVFWFNQSQAAPIPEWKKRWYTSAAFRRAVSMGINRADLCRLVWRGHAVPAAGPVSPANRAWVNGAIKPDAYSPAAATASLERDGFHLKGGTLYDRDGHAVEISLISNAGNPLHERAMAMIRQDLAKIGIRVTIVVLDFPSVIERITRTFDYEACLLPMLPELDPQTQQNMWLSAGENHPWNPAEKSPATAWEAEVDRLMRAQAADTNQQKRKAAFDRVQQILAEQQPMICLVHPDVLLVTGPRVRNAAPAIIRPQLLWNADRLQVAP